jgi:hypothetical protein
VEGDAENHGVILQGADSTAVQGQARRRILGQMNPFAQISHFHTDTPRRDGGLEEESGGEDAATMARTAGEEAQGGGVTPTAGELVPVSNAALAAQFDECCFSASSPPTAGPPPISSRTG